MNGVSLARRRREGGFLLLEIILATAIFSLGVVALGNCLSACLTSQQVRAQEDRARMALENRMAEIQASPALPDELRRSDLKGMFKGMTMIERRKALDIKNEDNVTLNDLHEITLSVEWTSPDHRHQVRTLAFDLLRGRG